MEDLYKTSDMIVSFTPDNCDDYLNYIKQIPILSAEENSDLAIRAQNGDEIARKKLIIHNLRLVPKIATKYKRRIKSLSFLDLLQEGNMGLIRAIETYKPEEGSFSNYAIIWIKQFISRSIENTDRSIRIPVYMEEHKTKYDKLARQYEECEESLPDDEIICDILGISLPSLTELKKDITPLSINQEIDNETDSTLESFLAEEELGYEKFVSESDNHSLFVILKENLSPFQYYIIYNRFYLEVSKSLIAIAREFNLSKQNIDQTEERILNKAKIYLNDNYASREAFKEVQYKYGILDQVKIEPRNPNLIAMYLYLKDELSKREERLFYYIVFGNKKIECYFNELELDIEMFENLQESINKRISAVFEYESKEYNEFKKRIISELGTKILNINEN